MIITPETIIIGGTNDVGIAVASSITFGAAEQSRPDTIFIQNDTSTAPGSAWYVTRVDSTHYTMNNATAPKASQYIGAFLWEGESDTRGGRLGAGVQWETTDASVVRIIQITSSGQAVISIVAAGTATLTARYSNMVSTLEIVAT